MQVCWRCCIRFCTRRTTHSLRPPPLISIHNRPTGSCTFSVIKVTSGSMFDYGSSQRSCEQCLRKRTCISTHCLQYPKWMNSVNICKLNPVCVFSKYKTKAHHWTLSWATFINVSSSQHSLPKINITVYSHLFLGLPCGRIRLVIILYIDMRRKVMFFRKKSGPLT